MVQAGESLPSVHSISTSLDVCLLHISTMFAFFLCLPSQLSQLFTFLCNSQLPPQQPSGGMLETFLAFEKWQSSSFTLGHRVLLPRNGNSCAFGESGSSACGLLVARPFHSWVEHVEWMKRWEDFTNGGKIHRYYVRCAYIHVSVCVYIYIYVFIYIYIYYIYIYVFIYIYIYSFIYLLMYISLCNTMKGLYCILIVHVVIPCLLVRLPQEDSEVQVLAWVHCPNCPMRNLWIDRDHLLKGNLFFNPPGPCIFFKASRIFSQSRWGMRGGAPAPRNASGTSCNNVNYGWQRAVSADRVGRGWKGFKWKDRGLKKAGIEKRKGLGGRKERKSVKPTVEL